MNSISESRNVTKRRDILKRENVLKKRKLKENFGSKNFKTAAEIFSIMLIISLFAQVLTGCKVQKEQQEANINAEYYYSFTDSLNNKVNLKEKPQRVVSLVGSYAEDPDYIFVVTMGDSEEALKALKNGIEKNPAWSDLTAVKNNRFIVLPKELFHYKPNAKWGDSYEYVAKILYPDKFE